MPPTTSPSANSRDRVAWRRLNASSWRVRAAPRSTDCLISRLLARRVLLRQLHQHQIGRAHDAHQDVVEVVGDAAGEPADRLELLRLAQLFLQRAPTGDVAEESGHDPGAPRHRQLEREVAAVGALPPQLELAPCKRSAAGGQVLVERFQVNGAFRRGQQQLDVAAEDMEPVVTEHLLRRGVELADVQLLIHGHDRVLCRVENGSLTLVFLLAAAIHLPGQVQRRHRQQRRQVEARALRDHDDHRRGHGAQQIAPHVRREVGLPDPPWALMRGQGDGERDRDRVGEEIDQRHAGERLDQCHRGRGGCAAEPDEHLAGDLRRQRQNRHVEQRAIERPALRVDRGLAQAARGGDDHRRMRPAQDQRGHDDDRGDRHVRAAGNLKLDLERRGDRRQCRQPQQRPPWCELCARHQHAEHHDERQHADGDHREDVPARAGGQIPEQNPTSIPGRRPCDRWTRTRRRASALRWRRRATATLS